MYYAYFYKDGEVVNAHSPQLARKFEGKGWLRISEDEYIRHTRTSSRAWQDASKMAAEVIAEMKP